MLNHSKKPGLAHIVIVARQRLRPCSSAQTDLVRVSRQPSGKTILSIHDVLMSNNKSKKPLRALAKHLLFGIPTNIAAGPLGFRAELDKGERSCIHRLLRADRADPTVISDEKNPGPSRIVFHKDESEVQGSPMSRTSTAAAILDSEPRNRPTGERFKYPLSQPISSLALLCPLEENVGQTNQEYGPGAVSQGMY